MPTPELGACDWFVWDLRRSELADGDELEQLACEFLKEQPHAEPPALAQFLVRHSILTEFQASRLLQGKGQGLVLGPYALVDALGTGSMGTVFKATSKSDSSMLPFRPAKYVPCRAVSKLLMVAAPPLKRGDASLSKRSPKRGRAQVVATDPLGVGKAADGPSPSRWMPGAIRVC